MSELRNFIKSTVREFLNESDVNKGFKLSHSFRNNKGIEVSQYEIVGGGYARVKKSKDGYEMTNVIISKENRGNGFATKLYIELNIESLNNTGKTLQSIKPDDDGVIELSNDGKNLWESLVKKGLAKRISNNRYRFIK
jgi:hypothetical protein